MSQNQKILLYLAPFIFLFLLRAFVPNYISDDAYITLSTVKHFLDGHGFTFNPGEYVYVITNPLWAFGIAIISWPGIDPAWALRILGWLCEGSLFLIMIALGHQMWGSKNWGIVWALLLFFNPVFLFSSFKGMETPLYLLVIIAGIYLYEKKQFNLSLLIASIAIWIRFDGIILIGVIGMLCAWRKSVNWQYWIMGGIIIIAYFMFGELYYNEWLPNTVKSKTQPDALTLDTWLNNIPIIAEGLLKYTGGFYRYSIPTLPVLTFPLLFLGSIKKLYYKEKLPLMAWTSLIYGIAILLSGRGYAINFPWYFCPFIPGIFYLSIEGLIFIKFHFVQFFYFKLLKFGSIALLCIFFLGGVIGIWVNGYLHFKYHYAPREQMYAKVAMQVNEIFEKPSMVSIGEVGTVRYFLSKKNYLLDNYGLALPEQWRNMSHAPLVENLKPEVVFEKSHFTIKNGLGIQEMYRWLSIKNIDFALFNKVKNRQDKLKQMQQDYQKHIIAHNKWYNKLYTYYHHFVEWIKQKALA